MRDESNKTNFTVGSMKLMAEAAGNLAEPSDEVAATISEDVTEKIRSIIKVAVKFMKHANRQQLACADINKALRWSSCQPIFGYECNSKQALQVTYSDEAQVFKYEEKTIDLVHRHANLTLSNRSKDDVTNHVEIKPNLLIENLGTIEPKNLNNINEGITTKLEWT